MTKPQTTLSEEYYRPGGKVTYHAKHQAELNPDGPGFVCRCTITDWKKQTELVRAILKKGDSHDGD